MKELIKPGENGAPITVDKTDTKIKPEDIYEIVLHNDDCVDGKEVVRSLMNILSHAYHLAFNIMWEAHTKGKSTAEVEGEIAAKKHASQFRATGVPVTVEKI